jgi:hypothetical protein
MRKEDRQEAAMSQSVHVPIAGVVDQHAAVGGPRGREGEVDTSSSHVIAEFVICPWESVPPV